MENLFEHCEGWENCKNEDLKSLFEKKMIEGNKFNWPKEEELNKLNEICLKCNHPLKIEERKCSVCGNDALQTLKLIIGGKAGSIDIYNYRCESCDRVLYSHGELD